jgi:Protein of unknown function (DUF2905)
MGKLLIISGLLIVFIGLLIVFKVPIPFGKLPGDIAINNGNLSFYFPFTTCLILSLVLSFLYYLFGR